MGIQLNGTSGTDVISAVDGSLTVEGLTISGDFNIAEKIIHTGDTNTFMKFDTDTISFETAGTQRINITSTGMVGINDATGNARLIVKGNSDTSDADCQIRIYDTDSTSGSQIPSLSFWGPSTEIGRIRGTDTQGMRFYTHNGSSIGERFRIESNGQVSIGDGTTDGLLTIKGDSDQVGTPSIRLLDGGDTREVSISNTSGDFVASVHGNDNAIHGHIKMFESGIFDINTGGASGSNTNRLRITADGEVLIGGRVAWGSNLHPNDVNKVVITGPTPGDTYHNILMLEGSETSGAADTGGALAFGGHDGSNNRNWANIWGMKENGTANNTAGYMAFHTRPAGGNPTERLRISSSGNVTTCGTSTFNRGNAGVTMRAGDSLNVTRSNGTPVEISRTNSDGNMINFFRGTNGVAQIGWNGSSLQFGTWSDADVLKVGTTVDVTQKLKVDYAVSGNDYCAYFRNQNANSYGVWIQEPSSVNNGYPLLAAGNSSGNSHFRVDTGGLVYANSGGGVDKAAYFVRAWINFDMTNSAIRDSGNVASVTDHGVGDFAISFSTNIVDNDYAIGGTATNWEGTNNDSYCHIGVFKDGLSTSSFRIKCIRSRFDQQPPQFKDSNEVMLTVTR
mgnify:CR=1 FL=1